MTDSIFSNYGIGLDRLFSEMNRDAIQRQSTYPPYNVKKVEEYKTILELAVAGFKKKELIVEFAEDVLKISGKKDDFDDTDKYIHKGIGTRSFVRSFVLSPDVRIDQVVLEDGLLRILLEREIPEHKKPREIPIGTHQLEIDDVPDDKLLLMEEEK